MTSNNPADGNLDAYLNFGPLLTREEVRRFDEDASNWDVSRMACLLTCTRSAEMLRDMNSGFPEAFDAVFEIVEAFKEHAQSLLDIAEAASLRMQIASGATD